MVTSAEQQAQVRSGKGQGVGPRAIIFLIVSGGLYGLLFSINKIATTNEVPFIAYVFWHTLGAGVLLLIACAATRDWPGTSAAHLRLYILGGAVSISVPVSLLAYVAPILDASLVSMVTCLSPICTYLMAMAIRMERFRWLSAGGVGFGLLGIVILVIPGVTLPTFEMVTYLLLALLAPVCFAAFNIMGAVMWPPDGRSLSLACGLQLGGALVLLPVMFGTGQAYLFPGPLLTGDLAILYASLITAVVWYFIFEIIRLGGPLFLSQFGYIIVLTGFGWGALIFGESLSNAVWIATALLFAGLGLLTLGKRRERATAAAPASD